MSRRKRISQFDPARGDAAAAEAHYRSIHTQFARALFRSGRTTTVRYSTARAVSQYDIGGGFRQRPDAWRFVVIESDPQLLGAGVDADAIDNVPRAARELLWRDHASCLENLRSWEVRGEVLVDVPAPVPSSVKYLFLGTATAGDSVRFYRDEHLPALRTALTGRFGVRLAISNVVARELAVEERVDTGEAYTGGYRDVSGVVAIEEFYFDNRACGDEFFGSTEVQRLYHHGEGLDFRGYAVDEETTYARS